MRWVHQYGPELKRRIRNHFEINAMIPWRVMKHTSKLKGEKMYLYRAIGFRAWLP